MTPEEKRLLLDALESGDDEVYRSMGALAWMVVVFLLVAAIVALAVVGR